MSRLITIPKAAAIVGIDKTTAYRRIKADGDFYGVPVIHSGGHDRINEDLLIARISGERVASGNAA